MQRGKELEESSKGEAETTGRKITCKRKSRHEHLRKRGEGNTKCHGGAAEEERLLQLNGG